MSASHKPSLHLSARTGSVHIGRESKTDPNALVGETTDVTALFIGIMLAKFGPQDSETMASADLVSSDPTAPKYKVTIERIDP